MLLTMDSAQGTDKVTILHGDRFATGPGPFTKVFECYSQDPDGDFTDVDILNVCYNEFNVGEHSDVAKAYRATGLRSLSVGDVVVIGKMAYQCAPVSWNLVMLPGDSF